MKKTSNAQIMIVEQQKRKKISILYTEVRFCCK